MTAEDKDNKEAIEVTGTAPSLDEVHSMNTRKLEEEDNDADDEASTDAELSDDDTDGDNDAGERDSDDADSEEEQEPPEVPKVHDTSTATELDRDIDKPGDTKVSIKGFDGKTYHFNNLDEVPDDFEPANYKALMAGTKALLKKEDADAKLESDRIADGVRKEEAIRGKAMTDSWDKDIKTLNLKDEKDITAVYEYMEKELKNGVIIDSFAQAYKGLQYDRIKEREAKEEKEFNVKKKSRGGLVQSGGTNPPTKSKIIEGPPRGVSLDDVHNHVLSQL